MSIPIICRGCGVLVGEAHAMAGLDPHAGEFWGPCPGKDLHPKPAVRETARFFGLIKDARVT